MDHLCRKARAELVARAAGIDADVSGIIIRGAVDLKSLKADLVRQLLPRVVAGVVDPMARHAGPITEGLFRERRDYASRLTCVPLRQPSVGTGLQVKV
jgi:hypothetical protein